MAADTVTYGGITIPRYECPAEYQYLVPGPEDYEPQGQEMIALAAAAKHHRSLLFQGPTGSGKNGAVRKFAHETNRPLMVLSMAEGTGLDQLIGAVVPVGIADQTGFRVEFRYGALPLAIQRAAILVGDEINAADERVLMRWHDFMATGDRLSIFEDPNSDGHFITPWSDDHKSHNGFMFVGTMNPSDTGQYAGTKVLNEATLDRMMVVEFDYLGLANPDKEAEVISRAADIKVGKARRIVDLFNIVRKRSRMSDEELAKNSGPNGQMQPIYATASTRRAIDVAVMSKDMPIMRAIELAFVNKLNRDDRAVVHQLALNQFAAD